ncbi:MAG: sensor histidine kinase, partial [Candidatus Kapaibacteriota bacterium]
NSLDPPPLRGLDTNLVANLYVFTDSNLTQTVIRNILTNAIKFTPQNGKITIDYEIDENKQTTILLIKDNGVGIPQDKLTSIFELKKDKTTWGTNNEKGTGLGLTLCKDFMLLNKGNIEIESQEGEGTKVMLTFLNVYENTI